MADLILEPYAVVQQWHLPGAGGQWGAMLGEYLLAIAQRCSTTGKCIVGHIKALAILPDKSYLRVSVVAPNIPASIEGRVPPDCTHLELTLNILVYGLERAVLAQITQETAHEFAARWKGVVEQQALTQTGQHLFHPKHHEQKEHDNQNEHDNE